MREIKFRAWDKELKKMYIPVYFYDLNILFNLDLRYSLRLEGIGWWKDKKRENIDLMQFIGLYDNTQWEELTEEERERWTQDGNLPSDWKGKGIYEGDIVKDCIGNVGLVKYLCWRAFCGFTIDTGNDPTWYRENGEFNDLRIIGNKFENPELSKKELK